MKIERDERKFDFHGIGLAIKKAREREGMTQEQLGYIVDRDPRTIMYHENDGQHPSLNAFYQMVTMFGISVDEYFYPDMGADEPYLRQFWGSALTASKASVLTLAISALRKCLLGCPQTRWTSGHRDQKKYCLRRRP